MTSEARGERTREKIVAVIIAYTQDHGYLPSYKEIATMAGLKSQSSIHYHIKNLIKSGAIKTDHPGDARAICVKGYKFVKEE